ncbi:hypothetical protein VYU27_008575 [Nannochloropsis oceanica]
MQSIFLRIRDGKFLSEVAHELAGRSREAFFSSFLLPSAVFRRRILEDAAISAPFSHTYLLSFFAYMEDGENREEDEGIKVYTLEKKKL